MKKAKSVVSSIAITGALVFSLAGCGNSHTTTTTQNNSTKTSGTTNTSTTQTSTGSNSMGTKPLVLGVEDGSPGFTENFNPFAPTHLTGANYIYEPLYVVNSLTGDKTPWLATSYKWLDSNKKLQFTIRSGVKWNDGTPFTADDVAFTFNMLKKYPALDTNGVWSYLSSVSASGNQVTFTFKNVNVPAWVFIAQTAIVQKKQWSQVSDPVKFTDDNPVGTGPFMVDKFQSNEYTLKKNPNYWQASKVLVPEIESVALYSNTTSDLEMSQGKFDESVLFTPNIQKTYIAKNPNAYHYWFPLSAPITLRMNLTRYPFNNVKFRQAMIYAIDKQKIYKQGEYGYETPANQSLLPPGLQKEWLDKSITSKYDYKYDPTKAAQLLQEAGFTKNSAGQLIGKNGKQLDIKLEVPTGWTDWIQSAQIIKKNLESLGIKVTVETPSVATDLNNMYVGNYDMALFYETDYANPYLIYYQVLSSSTSAPIGKVATSNVERWTDKKTDSLLQQFSTTTDTQKQHQIIDQIEQIMYKDVPVVCLVYGAAWNEYQTNHYVGWPTKANPYAMPSNAYPDNLSIITHLKPVK